MNSNDHQYVLVTGANRYDKRAKAGSCSFGSTTRLLTASLSGLGLGICTRLIDEFLDLHPTSDSLTILFTTRSARKSADTLQTLKSHLARRAPRDAQRVHLQPESVELTNLLSVRSLARKLVSSDLPCLHAVVLNAGIGGWSGLDWPMAVRTVLADIRRNTTWPPFKLGVVGLTAKPQFPPFRDGTRVDEPPLAEVFTANVFGHYMLAHWLMPLMWACRPEVPGKLVWTSSIEASSRHYDPSDPKAFSQMQHTSTPNAQQTTWRSRIPVLQQKKSVDTFFSPPLSRDHQRDRPQLSRPTMQVSHPGIVVTTIVSLYWIVHQAYLLAILLARLLGAPWSTISPYPAAASATFLALASREVLEIKEKEEKGGQGKWGTAISRLAKSRCGEQRWMGMDSVGVGRHSQINGGEVPAGGEEARWVGRKEHEMQRRRMWRHLSSRELGCGGLWKNLRVEWEGRLEDWDRLNESTSDKEANGIP